MNICIFFPIKVYSLLDFFKSKTTTPGLSFVKLYYYRMWNNIINAWKTLFFVVNRGRKIYPEN